MPSVQVFTTARLSLEDAPGVQAASWKLIGTTPGWEWVRPDSCPLHAAVAEISPFFPRRGALRLPERPLRPVQKGGPLSLWLPTDRQPACGAPPAVADVHCDALAPRSESDSNRSHAVLSQHLPLRQHVVTPREGKRRARLRALEAASCLPLVRTCPESVSPPAKNGSRVARRQRGIEVRPPTLPAWS